MSKEVIIRLKDDLDGTLADGTYLIGWDGKWVELDLSHKNAEKVRAVLGPYLEAGRHPERKKGGTHTRATATGSGLSTDQLNAIRAWARRNGYENVSDRGRVAAEIIVAFNEAQMPKEPQTAAAKKVAAKADNPEFSAV